MIEAMGTLMWERGFAATTPREVRESAGVGQGSMYHHFPTKRDLGMAAIDSVVGELKEQSLVLLRGGGDPLGRLSAYLDTPREALMGCRIGRLTQDPVVAGDPEMLVPIAQSFQEINDALRATIQEAITAGTLTIPMSVGQLATLIQTTIQGGYVLSIASQDRTAFEEGLASLRALLGIPDGPSLATKVNATPQTTTATAAVDEKGEIV